MAKVDTTIRYEKKGYGRGLILGLTLAESMLLLVFCLLLIAGAIFTKQQAQIAAEMQKQAEVGAVADELRKNNIDLTKEITRLKESLASAEAEIAILATQRDQEKISEDWRELVSEARRLNASGMTTREVADLLPSLVLVKGLEGSAAAKMESVRRALELLTKEKQGNGRHDWPPIINLSEAEKYSFKVGSAELTSTFAQKLETEITNQLAELLREYDADIIEIIGHTDEQPLVGLSSNLDNALFSVMAKVSDVRDLKPADNAGLGLARAISVKNFLNSQQKLRGVTILPYSAAQLILPGDKLSSGQQGDVASRRRIEIRVRARQETESPN